MVGGYSDLEVVECFFDGGDPESPVAIEGAVEVEEEPFRQRGWLLLVLAFYSGVELLDEFFGVGADLF